MFSTMIDNECNILNNMSKAEFREFRSLMIEMVLHTGNTLHFIILFTYFDGFLQTCPCTSHSSSTWRDWYKQLSLGEGDSFIYHYIRMKNENQTSWPLQIFKPLKYYTLNRPNTSVLKIAVLFPSTKGIVNLLYLLSNWVNFPLCFNWGSI